MIGLRGRARELSKGPLELRNRDRPTTLDEPEQVGEEVRQREHRRVGRVPPHDFRYARNEGRDHWPGRGRKEIIRRIPGGHVTGRNRERPEVSLIERSELFGVFG